MAAQSQATTLKWISHKTRLVRKHGGVVRMGTENTNLQNLPNCTSALVNMKEMEKGVLIWNIPDFLKSVSHAFDSPMDNG